MSQTTEVCLGKFFVHCVTFTSHLQRHLPCDSIEARGETVAQLFESVFVEKPNLRGYLLDDQGAVRKHVMIFVNDKPLADRAKLSDRLDAKSRVFVMQALSGG